MPLPHRIHQSRFRPNGKVRDLIAGGECCSGAERCIGILWSIGRIAAHACRRSESTVGMAWNEQVISEIFASTLALDFSFCAPFERCGYLVA